MNKLKVESTMRSINGFTIDFDLFLDKSNKDMHVSVNKEVVKKNMLLTSINTQGNKKREKTIIDIIKENDVLPINEFKIRYSDDTWDFNNANHLLGTIKQSYIYKFSQIDERYRELVKNEILIYILENKFKFGSIFTKFFCAKWLVRYLQENYILSINDFHHSDVKEFFEYLKDKCTIQGQHRVWVFLNDFMQHYNIYIDNIFDEEYFKIMDECKILVRNKKIPNIPENYFDQFLNGTLKIIDDESAPKPIRGIAGIYLVLSQTGLRIGELYLLNDDCLKYYDNIPYVVYKTYKKVKGENNYRKGKTFANDLTIKGIKFLQELYKEERKELNSDLLYLGYDGHFKKYRIPAIDNNYIRLNALYYFHYLDKYFKTVYSEPQTVHNLYCVKYCDFKKYHLYVVKPRNHQFRVHVINSLYEKGVPHEYIKKYMNHLSTESTAHYIREKEPTQKEKEEIDRLIRGLANGDVRTINNVKEFQNNLDKLKKFDPNNIKVITNEDELYKMLKREMTFTPKTGGFCAKSNLFTECAYDKKTNDFYCAYDMCGNLMRVFYQIDITYYKIDQLLTSIEINAERGRVKEVQKQKNKLLTMTNDLFAPQLSELKRVLDERGKEYVAEKYPETVKYIDRIDELERLKEEWKNIAMS